MADEIRGDDLLFGILDDALVFLLRSCLDRRLDFFIGRLLLEADDEVDDRDVDRGDTEGKTAVDGRSLRSEMKTKLRKAGHT